MSRNGFEPREHHLMLDVEQAGLLANPTRNDIIVLLAERPATTQQLAGTLGRPKGSVGYHLKALEAAGLIEVVRTRKVRAVTEKYYGRVARTYVFPPLPGVHGHADFVVEALEEMRPPGEAEEALQTLRHARLDEARVVEFAEELIGIAEKFAAEPRSGGTVYGLLAAIYPTDRPSLGEDPE